MDTGNTGWETKGRREKTRRVERKASELERNAGKKNE